MKLNIGSHNKRVDGYVNMDGLDLENVDIVHDLTVFPYPFEDSSVDEILMVEVLEHIPFRDTGRVLRELYRILKPGGKAHIQVPDIGAMCEMYVNHLICDCVPRKAKRYADYKADPDCKFCLGMAKVHTERWRFAFSGAQKHEFDAHLNQFTEGILRHDLMNAGFDVSFNNNVYKLCADAYKQKII